jgi:hypothetical protein
MKRKLGIFVILIVLLSNSAFAEDDFQYWSRFSIKPLDTKYVDFVNYWDLRFMNDVTDFDLWFTSQKLIIDPIKHLSLGINYTYLESDTLNSRTKKEEFKQQQRFELEMNPYFNVGRWLKVKNRNRMEFRWIEDKGSDNTRFRHLWHFEVPINKVRFLKSVYANNEIFYEFEREKFAENRATPIGLKFPVFKKTTFQIFYMIQSRKSVRGDWSSNQVLGTYLDIAF